MNPDEFETTLQNLGNLLQLEREARHAESIADLSFLIVNETAKLVPYRVAFLWRLTLNGSIEVISASSVSEIDRKSPLLEWLEKNLAEIEANNALREVKNYEARDFTEKQQDKWSEYLARYLFHQPLLSPRGDLVGGLLISRDDTLKDSEAALLDRLSDAYSHAFKSIDSGFHFREQLQNTWDNNKKRILIALLILFVFPIRQSVLAPAQVEAANPVVVAAPLGGIVEKILVEPNQLVKKGDLLFSLDKTDIRNQVNLSEKALQVAKADFQKNAQEAFACDVCKSKLPTLQAVVEQKSEELIYSQSLLERSDVRASENGLAIFSDKNEWLGRPVSQGERVLFIANPDEARIHMSLPVDDAIGMELGTKVKLYLNVNPFSSYTAKLSQSAYQADVGSAGILSYSLYADFDEESSDSPRIGLKGTAKVYGNWTFLAHYIFRKPFSWLRRKLGW